MSFTKPALIDSSYDAELSLVYPGLQISFNHLHFLCTYALYHAHNYSSTLISKTISQDKEQDYTDKTFLSTSNPHWTQLGLPQSVIDVLSHKGITHLTPVQAKAMAPILAGRDVIGRSRTGTGKTLAFGMPSAVRIVESIKQKGACDILPDGKIRVQRGRLPSMIVLCPTRELARQVEGELMEVCKPLGLFTQVFHGGVSYDPQVSG